MYPARYNYSLCGSSSTDESNKIDNTNIKKNTFAGLTFKYHLIKHGRRHPSVLTKTPAMESNHYLCTSQVKASHSLFEVQALYRAETFFVMHAKV